MSEHFIKEIEIKDYKLFKDFKAEGFGRVNLIGGKNNVGKTAFMEACYLISSLKDFSLRDLDINDTNYNDILEQLNFEIIKTLIDIKLNREGSKFIVDWILDNYNLNILDSFEISIRGYGAIILTMDMVSYIDVYNNIDKIREIKSPSNTINIDEDELFNIMLKLKYLDNKDESKKYFKKLGLIIQEDFFGETYLKLSQYKNNKYFYKIRETNKSLPKLDRYSFLSSCNIDLNNIRALLSKIKKDNKNDLVNSYLKEIFNVLKIDLTDDNIILFKDNKSNYNLSDFGDGIKSFLNIILTLLYNKDRIIYIDEIENGIHYTNFDKLWEIILTLSKEQNVQVFATTHSKECIESYARVAKKLEGKEITYTVLTKLKNGSIDAGVYDSEMFINTIEQEHEVRGW